MTSATLSRKARLFVGVALIFGLACGALPTGSGPTPTSAPETAVSHQSEND